MNYLFQVDLLDGALDYSEQDLSTLDEEHSIDIESQLAGKRYSPNRQVVCSKSTLWESRHQSLRRFTNHQ